MGCLLVEEGLGDCWVVRVKVGRQTALAMESKVNNHRFLTVQPKGMGRGDFPSFRQSLPETSKKPTPERL